LLIAFLRWQKPLTLKRLTQDTFVLICSVQNHNKTIKLSRNQTILYAHALRWCHLFLPLLHAESFAPQKCDIIQWSTCLPTCLTAQKRLALCSQDTHKIAWHHGISQCLLHFAKLMTVLNLCCVRKHTNSSNFFWPPLSYVLHETCLFQNH